MALKAVFSFFDVGWSLSSEDMRDVNSVSGGGANTIEMGSESSADSGESKMVFHQAELALSVAFSFVKLNSLVLYHLEFIMMRPISVNISDNARVFEIYNGVIDEELGSGGRVENVEVVIFDPRTIEVGGRVCMCMKRNGVFRVSLFADPYNVSINSNLSKGDVSCNFVLPVLIEKNQGVLPRITAVVLTLPSSWVI